MRIATYGRQRQRVGEIILPTLGWGKHRVRLYAGRRSGRKPGPTLNSPRAEGQREEKITPVWPCEPLCGADGAGRHPRAHKNPLTALVEAVWRKAGTAARTRFHPKTESEPTGWKYSRRKNRRFCGAGSLTTARSAGSCRVLKWRSSACEIEAMTLFSAKFSCLLRAARTLWGVPGLWRHECPPQELRC